MTDPVHVERMGRSAILRICNPPVNALSQAVRVSLYRHLQALKDDDGVDLIVLAGGGRGFSAGADIAEFAPGVQSFRSGRDPVEVIDLIERIEKPVVAAIHGFALGGGLELALGCHARIATRSARLALPEVALGLLPGAGGTQRLPRLTGVEKALEMMLSGQPVTGSDAAAGGLVDLAVDTNVTEAALNYGTARLDTDHAWRVPSRMPVASARVEADAAVQRARAHATKLAARRKASLRIVDCVQASVELPFADGMALERKAFEECVRSDEAEALQYAFHAERAAGKLESVPEETHPVQMVGVVGGGTMGRGIAISFANAGLAVRLSEVDAGRASDAVQLVHREFQRHAERGKLKASEAVSRSSLVQAVQHTSELSECDLVVEAVFEDMDVKLQTARRLGEVCRESAIIASNTSTLDVDLLAEASGRPGDFVGLHFFSPANVMRLVEVVRGRQTKPATLAAAVEVVRKIGKVPVISGVCWGFIGNRMLEPYLREVEFLLLEGLAPSRIDRALEQFGMAMGPCRMMDLAGVDVVAKVVIERAKKVKLPADPLYRIASRELSAIGRQGQKSGEGFYRYEGRERIDDVDAHSLLLALAARQGVAPRAGIGDEEIVERCMLPLINEGYRILEEGIAERASDIDVVWLTGYGFPPSLGGPMYHAGRLGADHIVQRLGHYAQARGNEPEYWSPADSLLAAAASAGDAR